MQNQSASESESPSLSDPGCCKNTHLYLKASFTGFPVFYNASQIISEKVIFTDIEAFIVNPVKSQPVSFTPVQDHSPPPLFGRILLHTIHQIKIPVPFS
jgi:hypothetical protein